jgi:hypothetical protein
LDIGKDIFSKKSLKELLKDEFCHTDTKPKARKTIEKSGFMPMAMGNFAEGGRQPDQRMA